MIIIPGFLISLLTFPGVIVHELSHQFFCFVMGVPVYDVKYFQLKNPSGYVLHERSHKPWTNFIISVSPFIVNTLLGALILLPASVEIVVYDMINWKWTPESNFTVGGYMFTLFLYWLGISILMHAFPSRGDAKVLINSILKNSEVNIFVKILVAPVIGLIMLGAWGSYIWLDIGYAFAISYMLPKLLGVFLK